MLLDSRVGENSTRLSVRFYVGGIHGFDWHRISRRHSGKANVLFADGHVDSETWRQLLYPLVENWTRFSFDNKKHWRDSEMSSPSGWQPQCLGRNGWSFDLFAVFVYLRIAGHLVWDGKAV